MNLKQKIDIVTANPFDLHQKIAEQAAVIEKLREAEKDAARYRWLRAAENQLSEDDPCVSDDCFVTYYDSELDATIDRLIKRNAAMKESV